MTRHVALLTVVLVTLLAANPPSVDAQRAILLLRHAERVDYEDQTGLLSDMGLARAQKLAQLLRDVGVTAIYTSEFKRTIQTAEPLAAALGIPLTSIGGSTAEEQVQATVTRVRGLGQKDVVVIVGHGNTVPMLLKALGSEPGVTIGPREHDDLFVLFPARDGPPTVLRLNY